MHSQPQIRPSLLHDRSLYPAHVNLASQNMLSAVIFFSRFSPGLAKWAPEWSIPKKRGSLF